ncbi:hypothetical protein BFN03_13440 [Rhodococcus sp. WMMA185]|uniref:Rv0361 family membrane protein n=1 Tax=Rhodococcus sp. WMMA185 TaxID=679318 RepID=UPI000878B672|nr:hypothetical protein [Rhodococcus sp. WMMA185]AOW93313.1 hypothetical protein BFN03_13440 [Rhodococcus sp. WMMA185]
MSDSGESPRSEGDGGDPVDPRRVTATPFIAAVAITVAILLIIVVSGWLSPAEENITEADRINRVVADFIAAHNQNDTEVQESLVCPSWSDDRSALRGLEGEITLQQVESSEVNGNRAQAVVRISAADSGEESTATWRLTRDGDNWLVCD